MGLAIGGVIWEIGVGNGIGDWRCEMGDKCREWDW